MPDRLSDDPQSLAGRLYDSYGASLYRYALMLLQETSAAEDAVHQVFASLLKIGHTALEHDAHYLRRALRNECYSMLRRRTRTEIVDDDVTTLIETHTAVEDRPEERLLVERALR